MKTKTPIRFVSLFVMILLTQQLFSQKNLIEAIVMTKDGLELNGSINYQQWIKNPSSVEFYKSHEADKIEITPKNTKWFKVSDDYYVSREITYTKSPRKAENLTFAKHNLEYTTTAFCLVLVEGSATLLEFVDDWSTPHYYVEKDSQKPVELIYFKYYTKQEHTNKRVIAENRKFQGQLSYLLSDCQNVKKKCTSIAYDHKQLSNLIREYNSCEGGTSNYTNVVEKPKIEYGVFTGVSFTYINFASTGSNPTALTDPENKFSAKPTLGASLTITPTRGRGKWNLYMDLLFKSYSFKNSESTSENYLGASQIKLSILGHYNFVGDKIIPYLRGGLFFSKTLTNKNETAARDFDYGFVAETGVNYKKFNLGLRYDLGGIRPYDQASSYTSTLYILLSYKF